MISVRIEPKTKPTRENWALPFIDCPKKIRPSALAAIPIPARRLFPVWASFIWKLLLTGAKREFGVEADTGRPQVAYKETINAESEAEGRYIKQSGGRGQYGHVWLKVKSLERGKDLSLLIK